MFKIVTILKIKLTDFFLLQVPTCEGVVYSLDEGRTRFYDLLQLVEFYQLNAGTLPTRYAFHASHLSFTISVVELHSSHKL